MRSAFRYAYDPGFRADYLGFRCALVQETSQLAEPEASSKGSEAEPRTGEKHRGEASRIVVHLRENAICEIPSLPRLRVLTDLDEVELDRLTRPSWASAVGRDRVGLWSEFTVGGDGSPVTQRMRWIPPGRFRMGSDDSEDSLLYSAKPQHDVTITHGFWLFDTPVTQQLWNAVSDSNPSDFQGELRPVEQVSWHDCQSFMQRLAMRLAGLKLVLPTEAEWEYACRAGTQTAYSVGDEITHRDARYWSGNADHGTVNVASYAANPWGLYDMHGNVWEWCSDGIRDYGFEPVTDPTGSTEEGVARAVRGGSWDSDARDVRSAFRRAIDPGYRVSLLGFRCALVQAQARSPSERSEGHGVAEQPGRSD